MMRFVCEYRQGPNQTKYGSDIYANSFDHAKRLARRRGIGEKVISDGMKSKAFYPFPSELFRKRKLTKRDALAAIHGTTFLAFIAMKSGRAEINEVLGDTGFLHEAIHVLQFGRFGQSSSKPRREFADVILRWERIVPGFRGDR